MGAKIILILPLFTFSQVLFSQIQDIILNTPLTGTHDKVATNSVVMMPGFSYTPSSGNSFIARTDPGEPPLPEYDLIGGPGGTIGEIVGDDGVVGAIPGQFSVSQVGGAVYNIPIECPPGINGVTPSVSLVYNSQAGNGIAGWGWNINGLSSVSRTGKSYYYNQDVDHIKWDGTDNLVYDGQKLFIKTIYPSGATASSADSIEYLLDNDLSTRVVGYSFSDDGPNLFKVWTSQGRILHYSQRQDLSFIQTTSSYGTCIYELEDIYINSTITTPGSLKTLSWNLTKISDRFGNDIIYEYDHDNVQGITFPAETLYYDISDVYYQNPLPLDDLEMGMDYLCVIAQDVAYQKTNFRLKKIRYTGDDHTINFSYETRNDVINGYVSGQQLLNSNRLTSITVEYLAATTLREYQVSYLPDSTCSRLSKITLTGQNSEKYNSTVIEWNNEEYTYSKSNAYGFVNPDFVASWISQGYTFQNRVHYPIELNADGKTDFFVTYQFGKDGVYKSNWAVFINPGTVSSLSDVGEGSIPESKKYYFIDKNLNGKTELYLQYPHTEYIWNEDSTMAWGYSYVKFDGYEFSGSSLSRDINLDFMMRLWDATCDESSLVSSDFDGDGKPEFLVLKGDKTYCNSKDFSPNGCSSSDFGTSSSYFLSDLNGNGKREVVFLKDTRIEYWEYSKSNAKFERILISTIVNKNDYFFPGDFNADGNEDLLVFDNSANQWLTLVSNGISLKSNIISAPLLNTNDPIESDYAVVDINHDGKSDIIQAKPEWVNLIATTREMKVFISRGSLFELVLTRTGIPNDYLRYSGEGNEDLTTDIFAAIQNPFYFSISLGVGFNQINKIYTGIGDEIDIEYKKNFSKVSADNVIPDLNTSTPNIISMPLLLKTVSNVVNGSSLSEFEFKDPIIHLTGKGFLGFGQIDKTVTKSSLASQTIELYGLASKGSNQYELVPDTLINKINGNQVSASYMSYQTKTVNNKTYLVNDEATSQNIVDNTKTVSSYLGHDNFLLPLVITTKSYADNVEEASISDSLTYSHNTNNWLIGQLTSKATFRQRPGVPSYRRTYDYTYYSNGSLHEEYPELGSAKELKTSYFYDSFGNMASTSIEAQNDTLTRTVSYNYSSDGRFLTSKTDVLGNIQTFEYYPETGLPKKVIDANDFVTEYHYDGLSRLNRTTFPDANETNSILAWVQNDSDAPEGSMYCKIEESSGNAPQKVYYDKYGKELRSLAYGLTGNAIYVDTHYDLNDRVSEASMPYFEGGSALWTIYGYDSYNRIDEVQAPDGNTTNYSYSPREKTVTTETTSGNRSTTTKTNSLGEVIESTDNGNNTVLTTYYASGLPQQISVAGAPFATTITYDIYGNRTSISDPDAGTITSEYNALGYLITQTDNSGNVTTNTYDKSGRVLTSVQDTLTTTYTYDSQIIGQISSVSNGSSIVAYDYDDLGRLESQVETLVESGGNKSFIQSFTYDEYGSLKTKTWSGGYGITFDYNNYGYLYRIRDDNYTLWNATAQNANGQYTAYNQGSLNTSVTYNAFGELDQMLTPGVRNMDYNFNPLGNLSSREDMLSNQKEVFGYDILDRLSGIEYYLNAIHTTAGDKTIYYDTWGNITGKTGIAAQDSILYGENGYGPHALTAIWHPKGYQPSNQHISYTSFNKVNEISDTISASVVRKLSITYGYDNQRRKSVYTDGATTKTKYFIGNYEEHSQGSTTKKYFFINSPSGLCGIYVIDGSNPGQLYYTINDHLGSITEIVNATTGVIARQSFDAWGNPRSVTDWTDSASYQLFAGRGFTGHEHLEEFSLINMNGRIYDPMLGRFLSPDPYVQLPDFSQSFNRYAYCLNNPLIYTDPSGDFFWAALPIMVKIAIGVGAAIGGYSGYKIADAKGYDLGDWQTYGYILGGATIGGFSGYAGATIAAGGGFMANTAGIVVSSGINSMGMTPLSGGMIEPNISFGVASFGLGTGELGHLGKKGNSALANIGYGFGGLANIQDFFAWNQGTNIEVHSHNNNPFKGGAPHSYIKGDGIDISVANAVPSGSSNMFQYAWKVITNKTYRTPSHYPVNYDSDWVVKLHNVRAQRLVEKTNNIFAGKGLYGKGNLKFGLGFGCVQHSSRALLASGVWYIPFNPLPQMLTIQLAIRQVGMYTSPYLIDF